jgi:seryl-tRNA synthetase
MKYAKPKTSTPKGRFITRVNQLLKVEDKDKREKLIEQHTKEGKMHKKFIKDGEADLISIETKLIEQVMMLPNDMHPDVPIGGYEHAKTIYEFLTDKIPTIKPRDHLKLCQTLDLTNFEDAGKVSGERFVFLKNEAVLLEMALLNWAMDFLLGKGFTPIATPDIVRDQIIDCTGFNPRDESCNYVISANI